MSRDQGLRIIATTDLGASFIPLRASFGTAGTCAGVARLLDREADQGAAVWLDAGDLAVGPLSRLLAEQPWRDIGEQPISATVAGNHEFDRGLEELHRAVDLLPFPMLCANVDVGLPSATMVDTDAGPLGVIGLTHPRCHLYSQAPEQAHDWPERVRDHTRSLRAEGARWVVAILHDGVDWWPERQGDTYAIRSRATRISDVCRGWVDEVDLVLGGHMPADWIGQLQGVPAGHAGFFAASALVVDLPPPPDGPVIRGTVRVPPVRPTERTPAVAALEEAEAEILGHGQHTWLGRPGAAHYLPDLVASALQLATGADAGLAFAAQHATQNSLDGAVSALPAGPVSRLDLVRLFPYRDDHPVVVDLGPDGLEAAVRSHNALSDPRNPAGDQVWWNWGRMPAGVYATADRPRTVAVLPYIADRLSELLDRGLDREPVRTSMLATLATMLSD